MSLYRFVYRKSYHLPVDLEHKAYWAVSTCNKKMDKLGEEKLFQLQEIEELRLFKLRDKVLKFKARFKFRDRKLKERWDEPYTITKVLGYGAFKLKDEKDGTTYLANGHLLKLFYGKPVEICLLTLPKLKQKSRPETSSIAEAYYEKENFQIL
ncbi:uncharacterized protein LOC114724725 [Neltuma alba]|uniref:uncharacterized protein LOC114724725 n=1 Tax=Neltuma alba TaxID=207710 RepID=UPI0010A3B594|nr:uncharacterized protein LOC114724725 [Prosopis alba]